MTAEELLRPRFEVTTDYPNSEFEIGERIDTEKGNISEVEFFRKYPHLFRELRWWEERTEDQMPKKLSSHEFPNDVHEILSWDMPRLFGFINEAQTSGCCLRSWADKGGYYPVD